MDAARFLQVEIAKVDGLWGWLEQNHGQDQSVWLVTWKKSNPERYVSREQVLDALIAYGWTDGRMMKLDINRTTQLISPRKQQIWAQTYKDRAARLEREGRMKPAGRLVMLRDQNSGLWDAMADVDALTVPHDLDRALREKGATHWWERSAPSYRRNVLRWIASAKTPETRARRTEGVASRASKGEKVPQF